MNRFKRILFAVLFMTVLICTTVGLASCLVGVSYATLFAMSCNRACNSCNEHGHPAEDDELKEIVFKLNSDAESYSVYRVPNIANVEIPAEYEGLPVTGISNNAFATHYSSGCASHTEYNDHLLLKIPSSITKIDYSAFYGQVMIAKIEYGGTLEDWYNIDFGSTPVSNPRYCNTELYIGGELLTELTVPESITEIGDYTFKNYSFFKRIEIPAHVEKIGEYAFDNCINVTEIIIHDSVTYVGERAFAGCENATKLVIGNGLEKLGEYALNHMTKLEEVEFGTSYSTIDKEFFYYVDNLKKVTFNGDVRLNKEAFSELENLEEVYFKGDAKIGAYAFANCISLKNIELGGDCDIYRFAFYGCTSLEEIDISSTTLTTLPESAFENCESLKSITLPESLYKIGKNAFAGCTALEEVIFEDADGWELYYGENGGLEFDPKELEDAQKAARYLTELYFDSEWQKKNKGR